MYDKNTRVLEDHHIINAAIEQKLLLLKIAERTDKKRIGKVC